MADANILPSTVGGYQTKGIVFFPSLVVSSQDGGRRELSGWVGSGASISINSDYVDDGSSTGISGNWFPIWFPEDHKHNPWSGQFQNDYALGSCEPLLGAENFFAADNPKPSYPPWQINSQAYYDNIFNAGEAGPEQNAVRNSANWISISSNPAPSNTDLGSVKCYPANQVNFTTAIPASQFGVIRSYANETSPYAAQPASAYPDVKYEAAWDIFGHAHTAFSGITFECMFWTYNHNQDPHIGSVAPVETNIDLNGDGKLWDLYMTPDTAQNGGVAANYSYGIWYLQEAYQEHSGWVDILAGVRYFLQYYVIPSGPGAPSNPLDVPLIQLTRGWEVCSTNYVPLPFRLNDFKIQITPPPPTVGPAFAPGVRQQRAAFLRQMRGRTASQRTRT